MLSLSATPIPRTMYMCMSGIRDMSSLETPPDGRRPAQRWRRMAVSTSLHLGSRLATPLPCRPVETRVMTRQRELLSARPPSSQDECP